MRLVVVPHGRSAQGYDSLERFLLERRVRGELSLPHPKRARRSGWTAGAAQRRFKGWRVGRRGDARFEASAMVVGTDRQAWAGDALRDEGCEAVLRSRLQRQEFLVLTDVVS